MALFYSGIDPAKDIPNKSSSYSAWLQWYKELVDYFGTTTANFIFKNTWNKREPDDFVSQYIDVLNRKDLIDYVQDRGLKLDENGADEIVGFAGNILDQAASFFKIGRTFTVVIMIIAVLAIIFLLYSLIKNPEKYASAAKLAI